MTILTFLTLSGSRTFPLASSDPIRELPGAFLASRLFLATQRTEGELSETTSGMFPSDNCYENRDIVTCHESGVALQHFITFQMLPEENWSAEENDDEGQEGKRLI